MTKKILEWAKKHYIITFIIIAVIVGSISDGYETEKNKSLGTNDNVVQGVKENKIYSGFIEGEAILNSEYKAFFNKNFLNTELEKEIIKKFNKTADKVTISKYFVSDNGKQLIVTTWFEIDGKAYSSNSRHNIENNSIEEFYDFVEVE